MTITSRPFARTAILMRTKDRPLFLKRALESVLSQTDGNWVLVVVNDGGSPANLAETIRPYESRLAGRLHIENSLRSEGRGTGKQLNTALGKSDSQFVAIHDDDDSWEPDFLMRARESMGDHSAIVTQSLLIKERMVGEEGVEEISRELFEPWQKLEISLFRLAESLTFPPIALLFRRKVIEEIGSFEEDLGPLEDWEFALRLFSKFEVPFLEEPLAHYRQRVSSLTDSAKNSSERNARLYGQLDAKIRNRLLRADLAQGKMGLGFLVNMAQAHGRLHSEIIQKKQNS